MYGNACFQKEKAMGKSLGGAPAGCDIGERGDGVLNLNIVTPDIAGKVPVMCWIHGGSNTVGSNKGDHVGFSPTFDDSWAERGVVAISVNYRLALHGFMHIPEDGVTNLALRDLIAALHWIQNEVASFGGDPSNVTVFGESAGAINICSLLCSPKARGLFSKAIIQSGGLSLISPDDYNNIVYKDYKKCVKPFLKGKEWSAGNLSALSAKDVYTASTKFKNSLMNKEGVAKSPPDYHSLIDGDIIPEDPLAFLREGGAKDVRVLIGNNACEAELLKGLLGSFLTNLLVLPMILPLGQRGMAGYKKSDEKSMFVKATSKAAKDLAASPAFSETERGSTVGAVSWLFGCGGVACVNLVDALTSAPGAAPLYSYTLKLTPKESPRFGSGHVIDLPLLFRPTDPAEAAFVAKAFFTRKGGFGEQLEALGENMRSAWTNFARDGAPGRFGGTAGSDQSVVGAGMEWPEYPASLTIGTAEGGQVKVDECDYSKTSAKSVAWFKILADHGIEPRKTRGEQKEEAKQTQAGEIPSSNATPL
jgi:para-nitrobenzyl esterase